MEFNVPFLLYVFFWKEEREKLQVSAFVGLENDSIYLELHDKISGSVVSQKILKIKLKL